MEDKDIFGIITGMIIDIRAPKSNVWVSMKAVFIKDCSRGCLILFYFLPPEEAGPDLFLAGGGDLRTLLPEPLKGFLTGDLDLFSLP